MTAYADVWSVISTQPVTPAVQAAARKLVGGMFDTGGIPVRAQQLADGTTLLATIVNGVPKVIVRAPNAEQPITHSVAELWIPRGFVVTPANAANPRGAGLPVVAKTTNDPYDRSNLAPGTDMGRWTPGGAHGQVLFTTDLDAGYPQLFAQFAPMYYSARGPTVTLGAGYDTRATGKTWLAFRPQYMDFLSHYDDPTGARRALFAAVNEYRDSQAVAKAYLMPRGFYRPAEVLSYLMTVNGLTQTGYPKGYQTSTERLTKDGPWSATAAAELFATGGTTNNVVSSWAHSHSADLLLQPDSEPVFVDIGYSAGNSAAAVEPRDQWIMAGRRSFQSADTELPPISWDSPPALNLGWLTFPVTNAHNVLTAPTTLLDADGNFWQKYYSSTYGYRAAIGPRVYCRGRVLGALPNGGMVIGAGVLVLDKVDRLMVFGYHPSENAALDVNTQGLMAMVHVWYVDFPAVGGLRLHADAPITSAWKDAGQIVLPGIKYESFWEFSPDGSKAVCMRDGAALSDINNALAGAHDTSYGYLGNITLGNTWSGPFGAYVCEALTDSLSLITYRTRAAGQYNWLTATDLKYSSSLYPANAAGMPPTWAVELPLVPLAAGYADGEISIGYMGYAYATGQPTDPRGLPSPTGKAILGDFQNHVGYWYAAFGNMSLLHASDATAPAVMARGATGADDGYSELANGAPLVVDISSQTVVADVDTTRQYVSSYTFIPASGGASAFYAPVFSDNPSHVDEVVGTTLSSRRVRVFQKGSMVDQKTYPNPSGIPWALCRMVTPRLVAGGAWDTSPLDPAYNLDSIAPQPIFPAVMDETLQPFMAKRNGETIVGYQVGQCSPVVALGFSGLKNPAIQDRGIAIAQNLSQTITREGRLVIGGSFRASFNVPDTNSSWFADAVVV